MPVASLSRKDEGGRAPAAEPSWHSRACLWLLFGTLVWGLSFPLLKVIALAQQRLVPGASSWFLASLTVCVRFAAAALALLCWCLPTLGRLTRSEVWHGLGLGVFGGAGMFLQVDGLMYTAASTSAFLTQMTCLLIPLWVALQHRRFPSVMVLASVGIVLAGVTVLARFDWRQMRMGRGEAETILATLFFTAQILWLERPCFAENRTSHFSLVMFGVIGLMFLPVTLATTPSWPALFTAYDSRVVIGCTLVIIWFCTVVSYGLMNHWQPRVTATEAGLIYCAEPLFASVFALFLPGWLAGPARINYANETLTRNLLVGGGLITLANLLIQIPGRRNRNSEEH